MLTVALIEGASALRTARPTAKSASHAALLAVARERITRLEELAIADPAEVLRVALPADARARLPAEVRDLVEEMVDATGELEVMHVDHVDSADDHYLHVLATANGRYSLHFAGVVPDVRTGALARVRGLRVGEAIVVAGEADVRVDKLAVAPNTRGAQKTLAILVNFANAPSQPYSVAAVQNVLFGTTSNFGFEASYQQTTFTGAVAGWFTIPVSSAGCDFNAIGQQALAAAQKAGHVLADYARFLYIFPASTCSWWGLGTVGGSPSQAWIHTKWGLSLNVVGHELGHNLGLFHAHSLDCGANAIATSGCTASEYGDVFDLMGNNVGGHYSAYQKERLGWLDDGISPPITTVPAVAGTATFDIAPLEDPRNGQPRALKIPRTSACGVATEWFYVEARKAKGFDAFLAGNANVQGGVLVHAVADGVADSGYLLDMTPSTGAWSDAALTAGKSFTDPVSGVKIAPVSVGSGGASVSVTFPPSGCTRAAPALTLAPGSTAWTPGGASVSFTIQAQNRDGCGCAPTAFDVAASVPPGWGATVARTASVVPGGSASASILVTPAQAAVVAFYPLTITAKSVSAPAFAAAAPATVAIESTAETPPAPPAPPAPPVAAQLAASASIASSSYRRPLFGSVGASIVTRVTKAGAPVTGASVRVEIRDARGRTSTIKGKTSASGAVTVVYAIKSDAPKGNYAVTSRATSGSSTATATASFGVN
ncbi:MAG: NEW3 domain-containing protein [Betaproteobacteria bacterium]